MLLLSFLEINLILKEEYSSFLDEWKLKFFQKEVEDNEVKKYAKSKGYEYYTTSASNGENVNDVRLF